MPCGATQTGRSCWRGPTVVGKRNNKERTGGNKVSRVPRTEIWTQKLWFRALKRKLVNFPSIWQARRMRQYLFSIPHHFVFFLIRLQGYKLYNIQLSFVFLFVTDIKFYKTLRYICHTSQARKRIQWIHLFKYKNMMKTCHSFLLKK